VNRRDRRANRGKIALSPDTGEPLAVIRPKSASVALSLAKTALSENDAKLFQSIPEAQDYVFVGWLERGGERIIDKEGRELGKLEPGDSFVTLRSET
jgi:hypothetical protein